MPGTTTVERGSLVDFQAHINVVQDGDNGPHIVVATMPDGRTVQLAGAAFRDARDAFQAAGVARHALALMAGTK